MTFVCEQPLLAARAVSRHFGSRHAVRSCGLELYKGETVAIIGESGAGKSTFLKCLAGYEPVDSGNILIETAPHNVIDLCTLNERLVQEVQRKTIGFAHQNPRDGLRMNVSAGANIAEPLLVSGLRNFAECRHIAQYWFSELELDISRLDDSPKTFSGGMLQRLQLARSLAHRPPMLFLDEPTSGLDVSVQARFIDTLRRLQADHNLTLLIVTHDLGIARILADRTLVMFDGQIVEATVTDRVFADPQHPYTRQLISSALMY